ncbi:MFS transporter [Lichenicola cladoniae]|uniref:MFS transporter n=1 Tax=Lichenicola cladoniae TaxID=1484109 RepID=A0A6M8HUD6_9PROT|nr:MFS transporter [Lichenicola cladoniae]NPD69463.1 MFS transporter [Acetobacteraceae bacterium]QKE92164.1 MFS transporter [Lichenicola cladoniae]
MKPAFVQSGNDRSFFGHPRGLAVLALTEGWVGFSFYGMQSLLVLYMTGQLLRPGHVEHVWGFGGFRAMLGVLMGPLTGAPLASAIMGLYAASIWATPILGGLVADRLLGRTRTIVLGSVLMTAGHFLLAFDASFLIALACLIAGSGCAGCLKAQVGALYGPADARRPDAFQLYTLSVSVAVVLSPLVCGTLGERSSWHLGFAAAGAGMLIGLLTYLGGRRWLPREPVAGRAAGIVTPPSGLSGSDKRILLVLAAMLPVLAMASVGNMEIFNGYLLWGQQNYALSFGGQTMPVSWLLSLDAFFGIGTLLSSMLFWRWWERHRRMPDEIVRMAGASVLLMLAPLILALASFEAGGHKIGLVWGVAFHLVNDFGFSNFYPVGMALYSRLAPRALGATVVNGFVLHLFLANLLVARLAGLLGQMSGTRFWLLHAGLIGLAAILIGVFAMLFRRMLAPPHATA